MSDDKAAAAYHPGDAPVTRPDLDALLRDLLRRRDRHGRVNTRDIENAFAACPEVAALAAERARADQANPEMSVDQFREAVGAERASHADRGYDTAHDRMHGAPHLLRWALDYASRGEVVKSGALIVAACHLSEELEREERGVRARADQAEQRIADASSMVALLRPWNVSPEQVENIARLLSAAPTAGQETP